VVAVAGPLIPERVPPLTRRLRELLRSLPPGREVTEGTLCGWLSVTEDPKHVASALQALATAGEAQATTVRERGHRPYLTWSLR
jgi:hypothetical protein